MYILEMLPKFILAIVILLVYVKLSGKSQIAPMSQLDQVGSMVIGALVGGALLSPSVSAWEAAGAVIIWAGLLVLIRFTKAKSSRLRDAIDGRPIQLVKNGRLLCMNFIKANLPVRDFETLINVQGICSFSELQYVWYELNGSLTIIKKGEKSIATLIIEEGALNQENLEQIDKDEQWVKKELSKQGYSNIQDIFCAEWFDDELLVYPLEDKCKEESASSLSHKKQNKSTAKKEHTNKDN